MMFVMHLGWTDQPHPPRSKGYPFVGALRPQETSEGRPEGESAQGGHPQGVPLLPFNHLLRFVRSDG